MAMVWMACFALPVRAQYLDPIGATALRAVTTNLNGASIKVGQVEAGYESATNWQVNPGVIGQPTSVFTYYYGTSPYFTVGSASTYPNSLGGPSGHANIVAGVFYGITNGVATNLAHINNYDADTFVNYYVNQLRPIPERIVNQSFTFGTYSTNVDQIYDNYAAQFGVLLISGAGFGGQPVYTPATCYNGVGVGSYAWNTPDGPTPDGRSKPDIIAAGFSETSYTTPQVSGAAALLMQAGLRGDGGSGSITNWAVDIRTLKALLLNGAVKPLGWTNSPAAPLDARYGAGMLNVLNSYQQLAGGKRGSIVSTTNAPGGAHPPTGAAGTVAVLSGWDYGTNTSGTSPSPYEAVNHYYFNVTNKWAGARFTATATLVWNRQTNQTAINNLDLFLYDTANSNLVLCSTSRVDNVEHLYKTNLAQGRYDLQVWKAGGSGIVSAAEPYALAFEFFSDTLSLSRSGTNAVISWPVYPDGFLVESATNLAAPAWIANTLPAVITNGSNRILLPAPNGAQFFRLRRPDF